VNVALQRYLAQKYKKDVLGQQVVIDQLGGDKSVIDEIKAEIARIDALKLGANLAQRSFIDYQNRRALEDLLNVLQVSGTMRVTDAPDQASFRS